MRLFETPTFSQILLAIFANVLTIFFVNLYRFVIFAKRIEMTEARLRVFCMTDDREEKTLEGMTDHHLGN